MNNQDKILIDTSAITVNEKKELMRTLKRMKISLETQNDINLLPQSKENKSQRNISKRNYVNLNKLEIQKIEEKKKNEILEKQKSRLNQELLARRLSRQCLKKPVEEKKAKNDMTGILKQIFLEEKKPKKKVKRITQNNPFDDLADLREKCE